MIGARIIKRAACTLRQEQLIVRRQCLKTFSKFDNKEDCCKEDPKFKSERSKTALLVGAIAASLGLVVFQFDRRFRVHGKESDKEKDVEFHHKNEIQGLPSYTADQVSQYDGHGPKGSRIWVSFGRGVYEITDFIGQHPGGDKILMAAGGALEPFWQLYAAHKTKQVFEILEAYRIGNLSEEDVQKSVQGSPDEHDPYQDEPKRHKSLQISSKKPFNAETPLDILADGFITPNTLFYVRNHLPVPVIDEQEYRLEVEIPGNEVVTLTLNDLKTKFPKHQVVSTIQCAGNRRSELNKIKEVKGLNWGAAAIGNARWTGARLVDVLNYAGIEEAKFESPELMGKTFDELHIQFDGLDTDPANLPYGASIPAYKAIDPKNEVLLAYEMNGEELPRDHGYPVRVVVPGVVGARNVKWLGRIGFSHEESLSHWQRRDYKGFSPNVDWNNVDFDSAPSIQELPVNSAICQPSNNDTVGLSGKNTIRCRGYAWSGGGRGIVRVDVTADGGLTWVTANLINERQPGSLLPEWSWSLWEAEIPVLDNDFKMGSIELACKAVDSSYNVQPDSFAPIWNLRGVLANAWHRVTVNVTR